MWHLSKLTKSETSCNGRRRLSSLSLSLSLYLSIYLSINQLSIYLTLFVHTYIHHRPFVVSTLQLAELEPSWRLL